MTRMEKLTDIIRYKNINLHGLHLYFSTVKWLIWENIFSRVFKIIFQWRKVAWHACMLIEFTINDS
jgi:hypothetical protein